MLQAFDPADRPTCEEALRDPYFAGLAQPQREPAAQPVSKLAFDFERRKLHTEEVGAWDFPRPALRQAAGFNFGGITHVPTCTWQ